MGFGLVFGYNLIMTGFMVSLLVGSSSINSAYH